MINVGIVDDHTLFRMGLAKLVKSFPECNVILQAKDGLDLLKQLKSIPDIDLLLLDLNMPVMGGLETLYHLGSDYPDIKVLVISMYDDVPFVMQAMKKGAKGYILKDVEEEELLQAIKKVMSLGFYMNEKLSKVLIEGIASPEKHKSKYFNVDLSDIDLEILGYLCQGLTSKEIADKMFRSRRTIEGHKQKLQDKTDTKNTPALVAWAFRNGIIK